MEVSPATSRPSESSSTVPTAIVPTSIDKLPIKYDGNPAHVAGVAHEVMRFYERTGHFKALFKMDGVPGSPIQ